MESLIEKILKFRNDRNWGKFHNIKDLLIGLNIEVAELQELFLWKHEDASIDKGEITKELADVFIFLVYISDHYKIDLFKGIADKIEVHNNHYPINKSKNSTKKYTDLNYKSDFNENDY